MAKRGLAKFKRRRKPRRNPAPRKDGIVVDATEVLAPALASYLATKFVSRVAFTIVSKRWPSLGKHAGALASAATFGGVYYGANKINALRKYEDPIVVGSAIAAGANIARTYLPKRFAWIAADYKPEDLATAPQPDQLPDGSANGQAAAAGMLDEYDLLEIQDGAYDNAPDIAPAHYQQLRQAHVAQQNAVKAHAHARNAQQRTPPTAAVTQEAEEDWLAEIPDDGDLDLFN